MLNIYAAYSRGAGSQEGAMLVFAHTVQEARVVGWKSGGSDFTDDYLDFAATRMWNASWLFQEADPIKFEDGIPHAIDNPRSCSRCEQWGHSPIGIDDLCEDCKHEVILETM